MLTAEAGEHEIKVRATDGTGEVQTAEITPPAPDGARGHHTITVKVARSVGAAAQRRSGATADAPTATLLDLDAGPR